MFGNVLYPSHTMMTHFLFSFVFSRKFACVQRWQSSCVWPTLTTVPFVGKCTRDHCTHKNIYARWILQIFFRSMHQISRQIDFLPCNKCRTATSKFLLSYVASRVVGFIVAVITCVYAPANDFFPAAAAAAADATFSRFAPYDGNASDSVQQSKWKWFRSNVGSNSTIGGGDEPFRPPASVRVRWHRRCSSAVAGELVEWVCVYGRLSVYKTNFHAERKRNIFQSSCIWFVALCTSKYQLALWLLCFLSKRIKSYASFACHVNHFYYSSQLSQQHRQIATVVRTDSINAGAPTEVVIAGRFLRKHRTRPYSDFSCFSSSPKSAGFNFYLNWFSRSIFKIVEIFAHAVMHVRIQMHSHARTNIWRSFYQFQEHVSFEQQLFKNTSAKVERSGESTHRKEKRLRKHNLTGKNNKGRNNRRNAPHHSVLCKFSQN